MAIVVYEAFTHMTKLKLAVGALCWDNLFVSPKDLRPYIFACMSDWGDRGWVREWGGPTALDKVLDNLSISYEAL